MLRRDLLKTAALTAAGAALQPVAGAEVSRMPVIDTHIHLYDPTRPGGVPWPEPANGALYRPTLPTRYAPLAEPHGVVGAIAIECSSWMIDNFWLQDVVERNPVMVGYVGDLVPSDPSFAATLAWLHRSPRFLGIRYGNLWERDLRKDLNAEFVAGLKLMAQAGLVLETANQNLSLLTAALEVGDKVPELRIVIDHLPHAEVPAGAEGHAEFERQLQALGKRPNVFVKGSEILKKTEGQVSFDVGAYKAALDALWDVFGEDRMLFGSDWPNSDSMANIDETFGIAEKYIATRSRAAQEKYFWRNSKAAYRWQARTAAQHKLG